MFHFIKKLSSWLLPSTCLLCKKLVDQSLALCTACLQELPILTHGCYYCSNVLPSFERNLVCGQCLKQPPPFDRTHALFIYEPPITKLILDLKFNHSLANARLFGELLKIHITNRWYLNTPLPTAIVPIPLHVARLKERGFNQAVEIARPIANAFDLPILNDICVRIKPTLAQSTLDSTKRAANIYQAFVLKKKIHETHIAVIDDIMTTGHTMMEFCKLFKQTGVRTIDVWCCARPQIHGIF